MHGEELVVLLQRHKLHARGGQLSTDHERHGAREDKPEEGGNQVEVADGLVVGRRDPLNDGPPHVTSPDLLGCRRRCGGCDGRIIENRHRTVLSDGRSPV